MNPDIFSESFIRTVVVAPTVTASTTPTDTATPSPTVTTSPTPTTGPVCQDDVEPKSVTAYVLSMTHSKQDIETTIDTIVEEMARLPERMKALA